MALAHGHAALPASVETDCARTVVSLGRRNGYGRYDSDSDSEYDEKDSKPEYHIIEAKNETPVAATIAINQSNDIQFGNKTYITAGRVTIKQIIKEPKAQLEETDGGLDNPTFVDIRDGRRQDNEDKAAEADDVVWTKRKKQLAYRRIRKQRNKSATITTKPKNNPLQRNFTQKKIIIGAVMGVFFVACLIPLLFVFGGSKKTIYSNEELHKSIPIKTDIDNVLITPNNLRLISRQEWLAQPSGEVSSLVLPVPYVIITHTATEQCKDQASCTFQVRYMQTFHIESRNWSDIGYNFLVGGDGAVYEGRSWDTVGAHTKGYNAKSIGIALIGTFNSVVPPERQIVALQQLIEYGVRLNKIDKDYKLFGHRQLIPTLSPGDALFNIIKKWEHFSKEL